MRFLAWHLGLGDAIAFAGLAVKIAGGGPIIVPSWRRNMVSVQSIFVNHPNIQPWPVDDDRFMLDPQIGMAVQVIRLGHYSNIQRVPGEDMIDWVYRTAGVDVATRFDDGVVSKAAREVRQQYVCAHCHLLHEDIERGFIMKESDRPPPINTFDVQRSETSILRLARFIEMAASVHCIDSAFLHLVEQLQPTGKLYYHKYARPNSEAYKFRHNWTTLE